MKFEFKVNLIEEEIKLAADLINVDGQIDESFKRGYSSATELALNLMKIAFENEVGK
jgi:hypothetical protein